MKQRSFDPVPYPEVGHRHGEPEAHGVACRGPKLEALVDAGALRGLGLGARLLAAREAGPLLDVACSPMQSTLSIQTTSAMRR